MSKISFTVFTYQKTTWKLCIMQCFQQARPYFIDFVISKEIIIDVDLSYLKKLWQYNFTTTTKKFCISKNFQWTQIFNSDSSTQVYVFFFVCNIKHWTQCIKAFIFNINVLMLMIMIIVLSVFMSFNLRE